MTARHYGNLHKNLIRIVGAGKTLSKVMTQTQCFRMSMSSSLKLQNLLIGLQKSQIHSVKKKTKAPIGFLIFDGADFDGAEVHLF